MKCSNEAVLNKLSLKKLENTTEIDFRLRKDLPDCRNINAKKFVDVSGGYVYNKFKKPANQFECDRKGCTTTGLLMMTAADETVTYRAAYDATEFAQGVVTFYVYPDAALTDADYPIAVSFAIGDTVDLMNADVYTATINKEDVVSDGFAPVVVNLANTPASTEGTGWSPDAAGAFVRLSADKIVGYSSIAIYDSLDDFDLLDVVTISCLTTIGGTFDLEVVAQQCQEARYNDNVTTLNFPVTGRQITPNFLNLFPMLRKGDRAIGYEMVSVERAIGADGKIVIADVNQDVCGYITVQAADDCEVSTYVHSSVTDASDLDEAHFIVVKNANGTTTLVFNQMQAGAKVIVRYPRTAEVEEHLASIDNLNSSQVSMTVPYMLESKAGVTKFIFVFDNVFITSFPLTLTSEADNTFVFGLSIGRDAEGNFMRVYRITS